LSLDLQTTQLPGLPPVTFTKSTKARHLRMTIYPDRTIRVTIPTRTTLKTAQNFLQQRLPWARKHLDKLSELQTVQNSAPTMPALCRTTARTALTTRLNHLAQKHGFKYNRLFVRNQKTKWGTCSSKNNISLNINLVRLPQEIQDYVIIHELVHLHHKNHSKKFWAEMEKLVPGYKERRERLKLKPGNTVVIM